jgi:hypothetical protein
MSELGVMKRANCQVAGWSRVIAIEREQTYGLIEYCDWDKRSSDCLRVPANCLNLDDGDTVLDPRWCAAVVDVKSGCFQLLKFSRMRWESMRYRSERSRIRWSAGLCLPFIEWNSFDERWFLESRRSDGRWKAKRSPRRVLPLDFLSCWLGIYCTNTAGLCGSNWG